MEIAYEHRFEQYDLYMDRPTPLVPRHRRLGVSERMAADGSILLPLDEEAVVGQARALRGEGIEALAICFLHSYMNAAHEERARELVAGELPHVAVTISSEVCPEIREYERVNGLRQCLCATNDGTLSGATGIRPCRNWIGLSAFADDVERRNYHSGNRIPTTDSSRREWSGGRCNPGAEHRGAERSRKGLILRHGRYHRQDHA